MTRFVRNGVPFTPMGANLYTIVSNTNVTFDPGFYNSATFDTRLAAMQARGYNAIRISYWPTNAGSATDPTGINPAYADNVADAIKHARLRGIYTILSLIGLPDTGPYHRDFTITDPAYNDAGGAGNINWPYLTATNTTARAAFVPAALNALQSRGVTADMLLAVELTGEVAYNNARYPFTQSTPGIVTASGTYDFSVPANKTTCQNDNIIRYVNAQTAAVKTVYPTVPAMVQITSSAYPGTSGLAIPNAAIFTSNVDALGLSLYPTYAISLATIIGAYGASLPQTKILTTLETGWLESFISDLASATSQSVKWQSDSCAYGVYGSFFFTWDSSGYLGYWAMTDGSGQLAAGLSPIAIGDGCGGSNNALLAPVTAGRRVKLHFYAPGQYAASGSVPTAIVQSVLSWQATMTQTNKFDGHHIELAETSRNVLLGLPAFTSVDIEQVGLGVIARGIITAPEQQIDASYAGKIVLTIPNITDQGLEVSTGMGYVDANPIKQLVANLGNLGTKSVSTLTGYDAQGRAITSRQAGQSMGWSAAYVPDGSMLSAAAPVTWNNPGNASVNGNSITRLAGTGSGYTPFLAGGTGAPVHTDRTQPCQLQWQIVIPNICQVGLRPDNAIGSPHWGFDFSNPTIDTAGLLHGTWSIIHDSTGTGITGSYTGNTSFAVSLVQLSGASYIQYLVGGLPQHGLSNDTYALLNGVGPFTPVAFISSATGEVDNAIFTRTVPSSEAWAQITYSKLTQTGAFLQLAHDYGIFVRQGVDTTGAPTRSFEVGALNAPATVTLRDGRGGDINRLRANSSIRLIRQITSYKVDSSGVYTATTPLGGGTASAQVNLEFCWRILNDPTFQDHVSKYGNNIKNIFPEYDANYQIYRTGDNDTYEYYITYEPAFAPYSGYLAWLQAGSPALPATSLGYKDGGPAADSQIVYPQQATLAQQEATQRLLYKAAIERMKRAVVPHITIQLTTIGDWRPPRAGDRVHIDYTQVATDKGGPWSPLRILTGTDPVTNPDPRVLSVVRGASGDNQPMDTWTLSNLGKYPDTVDSLQAGLQKQMVALQVGYQSAPNVNLGNPSFSEIDALHPVVLPYYPPAQIYKIEAFFLIVNFFPFRQPVSDIISDFLNPPNQEFTITVGGQEIIIPARVDLNAATAPLLASAKHHHQLGVANAGFNLVVVATPYNSKPDRYVTVGGDGTGGMQFESNGHFGTVPTGDDITDVDLSPTAHGHAVAKTNDQIAHIPPSTALATLPQHVHNMPPGIKELSSPSGITIQVDSGDGVFVERTAQVVDVRSNQSPGVAGFTGNFVVDLSRFVNYPGRYINIRLSSTADANNGRGRVGWNTVPVFSSGGLAQTILAQQ